MRSHTERVFEVPATPEQVWGLVSDARVLLGRMQPRTTVTMDGGEKPIAVGTTYHLVEKNGLKSDWTVMLIVPPKAIRHRIDLGVWDGGVSVVELTPTDGGGTSVRFLTPCVPWPQTWAPVRWGTWPLVLMEAKRTCDRFEAAVRGYVTELGGTAAG